MSSKNFNIPDKDNGLGVLAPDIDLCKQIPKGEFEDSALVWVWDTDGNRAVVGRYVLKFSPETEQEDSCPAPTIGEIIENFPEELKDSVLSIERNGWVDVEGRPAMGVPYDPSRDRLIDCVMKLYLNYFWLKEQDKVWDENQYAEWMRFHHHREGSNRERRMKNA